MKKIYPVFVTLLLSPDLFSQKKDLPEDNSLTTIRLPFKITEIKITDARKDMSTFEITPEAFTQKRTWKGNPVISQKNKEDIDRILRATADKDNSIPASFEFVLLEGEAGLKPEENAIRELTKIKAELIVSIAERSSKLGAVAEGSYDTAVFNASQDHLRQVYDVLLRNVTTELLKEIKASIKE